MVFAVCGFTLNVAAAMNTTAIEELADTIVTLMVALIPIIIILGIWALMTKKTRMS